VGMGNGLPTEDQGAPLDEAVGIVPDPGSAHAATAASSINE